MLTRRLIERATRRPGAAWRGADHADDGSRVLAHPLKKARKTGRDRLVAGQIRLALICALFTGCALVLVWRLFTFQIMDTDHYRQLAQDERHAEIPIIPIRGAL